MFFMVLDLRLVKIGCRETINFFLYICIISSFLIVFYIGGHVSVCPCCYRQKELKSYFELQLL